MIYLLGGREVDPLLVENRLLFLESHIDKACRMKRNVSFSNTSQIAFPGNAATYPSVSVRCWPLASGRAAGRFSGCFVSLRTRPELKPWLRFFWTYLDLPLDPGATGR